MTKAAKQAIEQLCDIDQKLATIERGLQSLIDARGHSESSRKGDLHIRDQEERMLNSRQHWQLKRREAVGKLQDCLAEALSSSGYPYCGDPRDVWVALSWLLKHGQTGGHCRPSSAPSRVGSRWLAEQVNHTAVPPTAAAILANLLEDPVWRSLFNCPASVDCLDGAKVY